MKKLIFPLWMLSSVLFGATAIAEPVKDAEKGELVSRFWLEDPLTFGAVLGFPNHLFTISGGGTDVDYSPAQVTDLTASIGYGPFQFSWKFALPQSSSNISTYGKSSYDDFTFEYCRNRVAASAYYQSFSSFYTNLNGSTGSFARIGSGSSKSETVNSSTTTTPADIQIRPDIHTKHYGAIGWYSIPWKGEPHQSFKISFHGLTDAPIEGFGIDVVAHSFLDRAWIEAGLPFVPTKKAASFQQTTRLQGIEATSIGVGVGLASSFVFESTKFYLDNLLSYGGGMQWQKLSYTEVMRRHSTYVDNFNFRLGVNYKSDAHVAGLHLWVNSMGSKIEEARLTSSNLAMEFSYAYTL